MHRPMLIVFDRSCICKCATISGALINLLEYETRVYEDDKALLKYFMDMTKHDYEFMCSITTKRNEDSPPTMSGLP